MSSIHVADVLQNRYPGLVRALAEVADVRAIAETRDIWCRDYMPVPIGDDRYVEFAYQPDYLAGHEHLLPPRHVRASVTGHVRKCPLVVDGGNIVRRGRTAIVTTKVYADNPELSEREVRAALLDTLELETLVMIPPEPGDECGHADGVVHLLAERLALVNDYSTRAPRYGDAVEVMLQASNIDYILLPYSSACYVNLIDLEYRLLVPTFQRHTDEVVLSLLDGIADATVPIDCRELARDGAALHCVTWQDQPLAAR